MSRFIISPGAEYIIRWCPILFFSRPARITLPSHRNSPTTYQRLYLVSATSSSRTRPLSFLRAFRYWLDHALITALLSLIVNLILPPVRTFRAGHFTQISYVRQRMGFTQVFDEAIRHIVFSLYLWDSCGRRKIRLPPGIPGTVP